MTKDIYTKKNKKNDACLVPSDMSFYMCFPLYKHILSYLYIFIKISIYILIYNYIKLCFYKEYLIYMIYYCSNKRHWSIHTVMS